MTDVEINVETMVDPIERFFEREYPNPYGMVHEPPSENNPADLVYLEKGEEGLHAVRFENTYDGSIFDVATGIHALRKMDANYHWIALPLDEFRDGEDNFNGIMESQCRERGLGIITVQQKGRGVSAKVIVEPTVETGDFLESYPKLKTRWDQRDVIPGADEGLKVIDYY